MKEKQRTDENEETEEPTIFGVALMPKIPGFTTKFNKIARKNRFRVANKTINTIKSGTPHQTRKSLWAKRTQTSYTTSHANVVSMRNLRIQVKRGENEKLDGKNTKTKHD